MKISPRLTQNSLIISIQKSFGHQGLDTDYINFSEKYFLTQKGVENDFLYRWLIKANIAEVTSGQTKLLPVLLPAKWHLW